MGTLEDLRQRLFNIGRVISEILDLFTYVKLSRSELDAAFHNLNTGRIERALDDLRNVIEQQRVFCGDTTGEEKDNVLLKDIKQEQGNEGMPQHDCLYTANPHERSRAMAEQLLSKHNKVTSDHVAKQCGEFGSVCGCPR